MFSGRRPRVIALAAAAGLMLGGGAAAYAQQYNSRAMYCAELEQRLANDWMRGNEAQKQLPEIEAQIRQYDLVFQRSQAAAERSNCYNNFFIFGRSLKRTPKCLRLSRRIEDARRRLGHLNGQREAILNAGRGGHQGHQDQLINELARYGCGEHYQREARRRSRSFFNDWDFFGQRQRPTLRQPSRVLPFATYRTVCVRLCDGYFYPVSFSTLPSRFGQDEAQCQSTCAAPAKLYVYRNPGEEIQQAITPTGQPYNDLPNAWVYQKNYVKGCSCKITEYDPAAIEAEQNKKADAGRPGVKTTELDHERDGSDPAVSLSPLPRTLPPPQ